MLIESQDGLIGKLSTEQAKKHPGLDADDLKQEARLAVFESTRTYDPDRSLSFTVYATRAIRNHFANLSRPRKRNLFLSQFAAKRHNTLDGSDYQIYDLDNIADEETSEYVYQEKIAELLQQIPFIPREVLIRKDGLQHQAPRSFADIAAEMWLPVEQVYEHYRAAKEVFRQAANNTLRWGRQMQGAK